MEEVGNGNAIRSIVCFGTGRDGKAFISAVSSEVQVEYVLDNYRQGLWEGYMVYSPSRKACEGKYIVITTTGYYQQIKRQLEGYELQEGIDFVSVLTYLSEHAWIFEKVSNSVLKEHLYIRPKKKQLYLLHYLENFPEISKLTAKKYCNATVLPVRKFPDDRTFWGRGGVVAEDGRYIEESSIKSYIEGKYEVDIPIKYEDKRVVYGGAMRLQWGHHLIDTINRLWYIFENDLSVDKFVFSISENIDEFLGNSNYGEIFRLLGIADQIEFICEPVKYREVIVPQSSYSKEKYYSKQYKEILNYIINNALQENQTDYSCKRLFLSRKNWNKMEYGQEMLESFFANNGFQLVYPETMSLVSMIAMLQKADVIAAPSGSGAQNVLFAKDGIKVIWIEKGAIYNQHQANIDKIKHLETFYLDANIDIFSVDISAGPYMFIWNDFINKFTEDYYWNLPDKEFLSVEYNQKQLKLYIQNRKKDAEVEWNELFAEANAESKKTLKEKGVIF